MTPDGGDWPPLDWAALRTRYERRTTLPALTGGSLLEVVTVDEDRLCLRQRLWSDCVTRVDLETALELLRQGRIGGTPIEVAEGLRRHYSGGPQVQTGCTRTPNLSAVVLQDLGYLSPGPR